ncbi:MAG: arylesterase [Thiohalospira sp.]
MRYRLLAGCLLWLLMVCGTASANPSAQTVLVLGDSLSAAYNMPTEDGWVALLSERLGDDATVINAAISGETTAGAVSRLPTLLDTHVPDVVIIALGGNDGLRGYALSEVRANLVDMITASRNAGAAVVLAGVRLPSNYGSAFIERFLGVFEEVARDYEVAFVPRILEGVAEDEALMQDDGIHPNEAAQSRILENIWTELEPVLDEDTATVQKD